MDPIPYWWALLTGQLPFSTWRAKNDDLAVLAYDRHDPDPPLIVSNVQMGELSDDGHGYAVLYLDRTAGPTRKHGQFADRFQEPRMLYVISGSHVWICPHSKLRSASGGAIKDGVTTVQNYELIFKPRPAGWALQN